MLNAGKQTVDEGRVPAPEVTPPAGQPEQKKSLGTRIRPSMHHFLRGLALEMESEVYHRVHLEDILDALLMELQADPELRAKVTERCR